jgi:hypothetical protein
MPRARTDAHSSKAGDVIVHQSVGVGDVPGLLAVCCRSALQVGLGEDKALKFASAVGRGLLDALGDGDGQPMLTLEREGAVLLTAQIAVWGRRPGGTGRRLARAAGSTVRRRGGGSFQPMRDDASLGRRDPWRGGAGAASAEPTVDGGRFARLADRDIRHFT